MAKAHHRSPVIRSIAASNTWLFGILIMLVGIVFVLLYNYSTYKSVKAAHTKAADAKVSVTPPTDDGTRLSNGCFVLKGNLAVLDKCGNGLYKTVQYTCGDNKKITLGGPKTTACKPIATWLSTIASSCKGHTSCDIKATPTPNVSNTPTPTKTPTFYCKPSSGYNCPTDYTCILYNDGIKQHDGYGYCVSATPTPQATPTPGQ